MKMTVKLLGAAFFILQSSFFISCADFFDQESDHVIYAEDEHLKSAIDTVYSMTGILSKLQAIADRTILLGEVRGDLVSLTKDADADLRDLALFNIGDDNKYNQPRDYYAVINNCNYFIEHAKIDLRNNRKEFIFLREYAAVKGIRAWTYLQLVLNYGRVPFVDKPILTKEESEQTYDMYDLQAVCTYFIDDLEKLIQENTNADIDIANEYPSYGSIRSTDSRFFYFPLYVVLGDLYLWKASETQSVNDYKSAALCYYNYISQRNGDNSTYPAGTSYVSWEPGSSSWQILIDSWGLALRNETYSNESELITMIPGDSIKAEGNYSELRNLFNSREENSYKVSIEPSKRMEEISAAQNFCALNSAGTTAMFAPKGFEKHCDGDLRLYSAWSEGYRYNNGERIETQTISKYSTRNVHIYRRQMLYLRMAEALNQAGYPRMAFLILSTGLNNQQLTTDVYPYYSQGDSTYIKQFEFPANRYALFTSDDLINGAKLNTHNTMGMHSRGSGWTPMNEPYQLPEDSTVTAEVLTARQKVFVDSLILNEGALEFAFEGTRYYDLMRFAKRQANPGEFMVNQISRRTGTTNREVMKGQFQKLSTVTNWYMRWNGQIGF